MLVVPNNHEDDQLFHLQNVHNNYQNLQALDKLQGQIQQHSAFSSHPSPLSFASSSPDLDFNLDLDFDLGPSDDVSDLSMLASPGDRTMHPSSADAWLNNPHPSSLSRALNSSHHHAHNRESSLSSLGSASIGPASPFSQNTSNPQIAISGSDGNLVGMPTAYYDDATAAFQPQMLKPGNATSFAAAGVFSGAAGAGSHDGLPAGSAYPSQPVSGASSIASNSPATPSLDQPDDEAARRRNGEKHTDTAPSWASLGGESGSQDGDDDVFFLDRDGHVEDAAEDDECSRFFDELVAYHAPPPKFDRTMTDIYNDELYSPSFAVPASTSSPAPSANGGAGAGAGAGAAVPGSDVFARRLQQFNNQALSTASPVSAGGSQMPFEHSNPASPMRFGPSQQQQQQRQQQQQQQLQQMQQQQHQQHQLQQHLQHQQQMQHQHAVAAAVAAQGTSTPQTISPKDAVLDYRDPDADNHAAASFPLFAQSTGGAPFHMNPAYNMNNMVQGYRYGSPLLPNLQQPLPQPFSNFLAPQPTPASNAANAAATSRPQQQQQQQPQRQHQQQQNQQQPSSGRSSPAMPPMRPITASLARSGLVRPVPNSQRGAVLDGATYTCTYHGCTQRFDTPALLQKHKREGHRQAHGHGATATARKGEDSNLSPALLNSQAGPHRCDRINPGTGKPCATVFSRPYDLTRHEDTIHNARKQKVRCNLCTEEKTFSRADALTRHFRVCHPDVEFPGKHRKRGGAHAV